MRSRVALASKAEVRAAVENAKSAQPAWAATNPQRRARVLTNFSTLSRATTKSLPTCWRASTARPSPTPKATSSAASKWSNSPAAFRIFMKGEFTDGAGPGIDIYSMRQPLGVVAGITPFNFPAMIPMWKFAPAIACGNAFILKPSERDPGVPLRLAELFVEAGLPAGILNVVNGDKETVDAILEDPDIKAVGFVGSTPIAEYIYTRGCAARKTRAMFRRCQEPHDHHARRRHGPGGRCADRRRLRFGGRALHGGLGRGAGRRRRRRTN